MKMWPPKKSFHGDHGDLVAKENPPCLQFGDNWISVLVVYPIRVIAMLFKRGN